MFILSKRIYNTKKTKSGGVGGLVMAKISEWSYL